MTSAAVYSRLAVLRFGMTCITLDCWQMMPTIQSITQLNIVDENLDENQFSFRNDLLILHTPRSLPMYAGKMLLEIERFSLEHC